MIVGFVILSHNQPGQLKRLTATLRRLYDDPPIACHHDLRQTRLDPREFAGVDFVEPSIGTGWGKWSLVAGTLAALRLLYAHNDPDWFVLLSAADYPVADPADVRAFLSRTTADALMDYRRTGWDAVGAYPEGGCDCNDHHGSPANLRLARSRYLYPFIKVPRLRREPWRVFGRELPLRVGSQNLQFHVDVPWSPYRDGFQCYYGSQWLTANRRVARHVLRSSPKQQALERWMKWRIVPDEAFFQSLLCNDPAFRVDPDPRRFSDWGGGGAHPRWLDRGGAEQAIARGAHFARKFRPDAPALDHLDAHLGR